MRCKPGDLAIVTRSFVGNEGKIVQCLRLATEAEVEVGRFFYQGLGPVWKLDRLLPSRLGDHQPLAYDGQLRPLRDSEGEDEILRLAGSPVEFIMAKESR